MGKGKCLTSISLDTGVLPLLITGSITWSLTCLLPSQPLKPWGGHPPCLWAHSYLGFKQTDHSCCLLSWSSGGSYPPSFGQVFFHGEDFSKYWPWRCFLVLRYSCHPVLSEKAPNPQLRHWVYKTPRLCLPERLRVCPINKGPFWGTLSPRVLLWTQLPGAGIMLFKWLSQVRID